MDCVAGQCECLPSCEGRDCRASDGCGGSCGPCAEDLSCPDCLLRLVRIDQQDFAGRVAAVTLGIDYHPRSGDEPAPRIASIRIGTGADMRLDGVLPGPALIAADKRLYRYTHSGTLAHRLEDGSYQIRVLSGETHRPIEAGRWMTLRFSRSLDLDPDEVTADDPVSFWLVREEKTLAPAGADARLQATDYARPIVIAAQEIEDAP